MSGILPNNLDGNPKIVSFYLSGWNPKNWFYNFVKIWSQCTGDKSYQQYKKIFYVVEFFTQCK